MGPLDQRSKTTPHQKMARELIAKIKLCTIRSPWPVDEFLYNAHTYFFIIFMTGFRIWRQQIYRKSSTRKKWKYEWRASGRTAAWIHRNRKNKMEEMKKNRVIYCMNCRTGCRSSERIWSMKVVLQSHGETRRLGIETLPALLMNHFGYAQCLHSLPERPKLRRLLEDENNEGPVQKTQWWSRTSCWKFWWLDNSRSQGSQWQLWISKQSPICSRGARPSHSMDPSVSVQKKTSQETQRSLQKFLEPERNPKVIFILTIPWNLANLVKIFPGIIVRQHHTDQKQMGLLKEQCVEWKKGHLPYCCNRV